MVVRKVLLQVFGTVYSSKEGGGGRFCPKSQSFLHVRNTQGADKISRVISLKFWKIFLIKCNLN